LNEDRMKALQELDCIEGALDEARRLVEGGANPQDIMRDFSKTKTSSSWIVVVANMAAWWDNYKRRMEGK